MKIEVDITKPPKEEAARIEKLLTDLQVKNKSKDLISENNKHFLNARGIFKKEYTIEQILEIQRKMRDEWE